MKHLSIKAVRDMSNVAPTLKTSLRHTYIHERQGVLELDGSDFPLRMYYVTVSLITMIGL